MGVIAEIVEGFILAISKFFHRHRKYGGWERLNINQVPNWVERESHKFHNKHQVKHHDLRKHFVGKYYIYRVYYKKSAYGRIIEEYYRKHK
ncbi:MAG TPA: hypothetical protein VJB35_00105 [Candidatus Nanoarchaeia archaeon]|nr:hypothetical protein [Candidatus Nanoarchaeia archaeon]